MHRAPSGDIRDAILLIRGEIAVQRDFPIYQVDVCALVVFAVFDVAAMDALVSTLHLDTLQGPLLPPNIQEDSHRGSSAQCGEQQLIRPWTKIVADVDGFICHKGMTVGHHHLLKIFQASDSNLLQERNSKMAVSVGHLSNVVF